MNSDKIVSDNAYDFQIILQELRNKYGKEEKMVRDFLKESRYSHTIGVVELAVELALVYGESPEEAYLAALFHDYKKYIKVDEAREYLKEMDILKKVKAGEDLRLYHGMVAAYALEKEYSEQMLKALGSRKAFDRVLDAMRYHTFGRKRMTMLDKIIYIADGAEPGRDYEGVALIRELMRIDINKALLHSVNGTISHVIALGQNLHISSVKMRNRLIFEMSDKNL